ncbi:hypothetical protein COT95_02475 [Candidatus Falkowbacteria bacterium CG10_big_fil_rev_8_21_14_0_10_37_6]|uniref:Uncharacterized protein n=1 Tax=Candidatus Falkowbacteria bacterium CG10_big_fil_rev_8_21_14_0_10_37_6 TaxID=1974563 RepID=A0A2H0V6Q3_9BACT|nr:MAG: hypothetical protein COT95_02475 [Candidatus Falkowbacteria bacterium CG10_big_fil_rev_8_21_14_0_10_37_6]
MINKEDMKPGLLVWWSGGRYINRWSCPAIVTAVEDKWFKVRTLDNFKETGQLKMNEVPDSDKSIRSEMRLCTLDEVHNYFKKHKRNFEDAVTEKTRALKDAQKRLVEYEEKIGPFLKTL